jgi:PRC-barrel domain
MTTTQDLENMEGRTAVDTDGAKLGKIGQVYLDDRTGQPLWVTISTGMFGTKESFAPLYGSRANGDDLQLAVTKDMVKGAPGVDADGHIGESENDALYDHYAGYLGDGQYQDRSADGREEEHEMTLRGQRRPAADSARPRSSGRPSAVPAHKML